MNGQIFGRRCVGNVVSEGLYRVARVPIEEGVEFEAHVRTLSEVVAASCSERPRVPVLGAPGRGWMRGKDLVAIAESLQDALTERGLRPGDAVAVMLPNGPEMALAFFAVSAVATCAPLNPQLRSSEFDFYLDDLDACAVLVHEDEADGHAILVAARQRAIPILRIRLGDGSGNLDNATAVISGPSIAAHNQPPRFAETVALVLHTSGTTAKPKIVPLSHANLVQSASNIAAALELNASDRSGNIMPLFHIHGLLAGLCAPLISGGSVLACPGFIAPEVLGWFREAEVTFMTAVPTMLQSVLERAQQHPHEVNHPQLRFIRSSSSALPPPVMAGLVEVFGVPVVEAYGMTEASHQMCSNPIGAGLQRAGSVGVAAGPEVAVMNDVGALLAFGEIGEVVIRGVNVTDGYVASDPSINERAFTNGWFRTGDQGHLDSQGFLTLTGRLKEIINRGGEKIAPREVDEVLLDHPAVRQAVCFGVPDRRLGEQIAAVVVLHASATTAERELREFVSLRVAAFKVPRVIVIATSIPMGPTGKLQRIGLATQLGLADLDAGSSEVPHTSPRNAVEELICGWWCATLGVRDVSVHAHFLDLGGDSILAAKLLTRVRTDLGIDIALVDFFDAPTVAAQSALIEVVLNSDE